MKLTLDLLREVAAQVIGESSIQLSEEMSAADVPGWDSLNHTLIVMELSERLGLALDAASLNEAPTMSAFIMVVNRLASGETGVDRPYQAPIN